MKKIQEKINKQIKTIVYDFEREQAEARARAIVLRAQGNTRPR